MTYKPSHFQIFSPSAAGFVSQCLFTLALFVTMGCDSGQSRYPVSGSITFNGEIVPEGHISFAHQDGRTTPRATQIVEGKYFAELPAGPHKVIIEASKFIGPEDKVMGLRPRDQYLPDKFNVDSILSIDVKPEGENLFDFSLTN